MIFAITLAVTAALCFALRNFILKWPVALYALCALVSAVFVFAYFSNTLPREVWMVLFDPIQKALLPLALFVVVMYIGLLPPTSKASLWLRPIRAELSIAACLLMVGHVVIYIGSYFPRLFNGSELNLNIVASFVIAIVLFVLLLVLGVTSLQFVKKRMDTKTWKNVQRLAYVFFVLVYAHLILILAPAALQGGIRATESVAIYSIIFGIYIIGRPLCAMRYREDPSLSA